MPLPSRAPLHLLRTPAFLRLALLLFWAMPLAAQSPAARPASKPATQPSASAASAQSTAQPAPILRATVRLDGPWRFAIGDDPRWADPAYDDSAWPTVDISQPASSQGIDSYSGFAWYRLRLDPRPLATVAGTSAGQPLELLVTPNSVGQLAVYINGIETGRTRGMDEQLSMYQSPPFTVPLPPSPNTPIVLAIRSWAGPSVTIHRGILSRVELGPASDLADRLQTDRARQWDENAVSSLVIAFLFFCVSVLGFALYLAQRNHPEYLWLGILCVTVAIRGAFDAIYGLSLIPLSVYQNFSAVSGHIFMAVTAEFVLRFTGSKAHKTVRIFQASVLALALFYFVHLDQVYEILSVAAEVVFCVLVCVLLFRAWRAGRTDAGVMLVPFFLGATADSANTVIDYAASHHWLPDTLASPLYHVGPIQFGTGIVAYSIFLLSLIAVILYRFIRVSQDEQRSDAEIAAARSVQSLLIPTQLPSNKNFMLESAYLPVHGVGGDFFQVLPLQDESLLLVVGDVSGKGLQAAMNSSTLVGALRNELAHEPATVLNHLNRVLIGAVSSPGNVPDLDAAPCFATCLCARIYPSGKLVVANAGHLGPYRDGRELELPSSLPLGVIAGVEYEQVTYHLDQGDRLVFLSDGVVEAQSASGELFGFERTQQVSNESARYIAQTARHFGQTDDITVISIYIASRTARHES
ncbi:MAG TPA: SpoIIE family protein phosphatase, partial [Terracidiphilus sp.]|nr:SpoIIE family protein phosphatase [Terracidiphilus sp.]